jgi:gamma-glutamyltranspeptidase / glutathione hydrolase
MGSFTTRPEILGTFGVVATTHWLATTTGMAILERGGNAFDAAVAAGFALQVVEPHLNGLLGDMTVLLARGDDGKPRVVCGQGVAPAGATLEHYRGLGLDLVPGSGLLAAVVPGAFDAWMLLLRDYGTLALEDVLSPAIGFAEQGYPLVPNISSTIDTVADLFREEWPTSAAIYLPGGEVPSPGTLFRNPALAATYRRIRAEGEAAGGNRERRIEAARRSFRGGFVGEAVDSFCRDNALLDSSGERHRGLLTGADMAGWEATEELPLTYDYGGLTLCKTAPWGQGPVLLQQLALLTGYDIASLPAASAAFIHLVTECSKLAFADREAYYGDTRFSRVPIDVLLSRAYNDGRRRLVTDAASLELRPGSVPGHEPAQLHAQPVAKRDRGLGLGEPTVARFDEPVPTPAGATRGDTCHLDIIDRWGNMISATPSGGWLQSSPAIPALGCCLGNRAQMFSLQPGAPAALGPGRRPRTTLSPGLALRGGEPYLVFGTPGGDQQDQWALHFLLRHLHHGMNLQEAIDAPGFNTEHWPNSFYPHEAKPGHLAIEGRVAPAEQAELRRRGHRLEVREDWSLGRMTAAAKDRGILKAAANPRFMQGYAIGR